MGVMDRSDVCHRNLRILSEPRWIGGVLGTKKSQNRFPGSAPHERLTYGVKGTEVVEGSCIEGGRCSDGFSARGCTCFWRRCCAQKNTTTARIVSTTAEQTTPVGHAGSDPVSFRINILRRTANNSPDVRSTCSNIAKITRGAHAVGGRGIDRR